MGYARAADFLCSVSVGLESYKLFLVDFDLDAHLLANGLDLIQSFGVLGSFEDIIEFLEM